MNFRQLLQAHHAQKEIAPMAVHPGVIESLQIAAGKEVKKLLSEFHTHEHGLAKVDIRPRLKQYGFNEIAADKKASLASRFLANFKDPLSLLLVVLGIISYLTEDYRATIIIFLMMGLSVILRFIQEVRADRAAEKLKAMVHTTATVMRHSKVQEIPLRLVVPGDIILLSAGDMVPADVRLMESRDLFANQATLTGESLPVEKHAPAITNIGVSPLEFNNICFLGTAIESGTATALVIATGHNTYFGSLTKLLVGDRELTSFDKGIDKFTWLMIRLIAVMVPTVFVINGLSKGNWLEAFLFALAVAVGLTPELLPMIVTVNLSKGALDMSKKKVIVKRLAAIQNFGAMDVLCTDKTGTLTEGRVVLVKHLDIEGNESDAILDYGYLNSYYQTGLKNLLDTAVLEHSSTQIHSLEKHYSKIDELPWDFVRRRMSVILEDKSGQHILICKGAVEEVLSCTKKVRIKDKVTSLKNLHHKNKSDLVTKLSAEGFRLIALAYKELPNTKKVYKVSDESDLILLGFLAFLDPPKATAGQAIADLEKSGVAVKILTGDNELVTEKVCREVGLLIKGVLRGIDVESMSEADLIKAVGRANVFDKLEPTHKQRVIKALQAQGHVVGFLGDGINDAPALRTADVGISVDSAADIAKESSDIILLEKSLLVLKDGVREGRKIFGNIVKYIKMAASSNFGNMFSVIGGSIFLPFLPMLPLQIITNNLLYDFSQITIPTDKVDEEYLQKPRHWDISQLRRFILYIGPVSSLFDYATYFVMLFLFNCWANPALFHTGWFVESLFTQTLIIHIIRTNKIPFIQSRASWWLTGSTLAVVGIGAWLPYSPLAKTLGFAPLPPMYWAFLLIALVLYFVLTQLMKLWFLKRYGWE